MNVFIFVCWPLITFANIVPIQNKVSIIIIIIIIIVIIIIIIIKSSQRIDPC